MFHWQSALRLVIVALVLGLSAPALAQVDSDAADAVLDAPDEAPKPTKKRRDRSDWGNWRNYEPSLLAGFGVTFEQADSSLQGRTGWLASTAFIGCRLPQIGTTGDNCREWDQSEDGFYSGGAFNLAGRVMLPEFDVRSKPRLFAQVTWVSQRQKNKPLANDGPPREIWLDATGTLGNGGFLSDPYVRLEQSVNPASSLFVGVGASFLLPVDMYKTRLYGGVNYYRNKSTVSALYDFTDSPRPNLTQLDATAVTRTDLIIHGIAPSIGIDVEIDTFKAVQVGFFTEFYAGIPLSGDQWETRLVNGFPSSGGLDDSIVNFSHDRGVLLSLMLGLRFTYGGD